MRHGRQPLPEIAVPDFRESRLGAFRRASRCGLAEPLELPGIAGRGCVEQLSLCGTLRQRGVPWDCGTGGTDAPLHVERHPMGAGYGQGRGAGRTETSRLRG